MKISLYLQLAHLSYIIILPIMLLVSDFGKTLIGNITAILIVILVLFIPMSAVWFSRGIKGTLYNVSKLSNVLLGTTHLLLGLLGVGFILGMLSR